MSSIIELRNFNKSFYVRQREKKFSKKLFRYFVPEYEKIEAVSDLSFTVNKGERIAFIGPNGAGKSTTIKALTGIFSPTEGEVKVFGMEPFQNRKKISYLIGTVFGQRSQLWYHLPAIHSYKLLATIYDLKKSEYRNQLDQLIDQFDLSSFIDRPVKTLSLGQRMRCEIVASLLHQPKVLFLDEPTIGLDIISKSAVRELILDRSRRFGTTIFLTSHDIADIERVCDRVILINHGKLLLDVPVSELNQRFQHRKWLNIRTSEPFKLIDLQGVSLRSERNLNYTFEIDQQEITTEEVMQYLSKCISILDFSIQDPPLEEIIKDWYLN